MIVLDASAVIEMVQETDMGIALKGLALENERYITCELMRAEVASVFRKFVHTQGIDTEAADRHLAEATSLPDEYYPLEDLQSEALRESIRLDHSVYDMFYFVLARRTGATLFTTDRKLQDLCRKHGVNCIAELELERPSAS